MEFKDERINTQLSKIYRNGIIFALIVTLCYAVVRFFYLKEFSMLNIKYLVMEILISLYSVIFLIVSAINFSGKKDERVEAEKAKFYLNGAKIFILVAIFAYAMYIPISLRIIPNDSPTNIYINSLLTMAFIYIYYNFRRHGIEINYSIIQKPKNVYLLCVLRNIGKFALFAFIPFMLSAIINYWFLHLGINYIMHILRCGATSVFLISAEYFLISYIEKLYYDDDRPILLKRGLIIFAIIPLIALLWDTVGLFITSYSYTHNLAEAEQRELFSWYLMFQQNSRSGIACFNIVWIGIPLLSSMAVQLADKKLFTVLKVWTITIIAYIFQEILLMSSFDLIRDAQNVYVRGLIDDVMSVVSYVEYAAVLIPVAMFIFAIFRLIKTHKLSKSLCLIPILIWVALGVLFNIGFRTPEHVQYIHITVNFVAQAAIYLILIFAVKKYDNNRLENEYYD